jgi:hypothetical protein
MEDDHNEDGDAAKPLNVWAIRATRRDFRHPWKEASGV